MFLCFVVIPHLAKAHTHTILYYSTEDNQQYANPAGCMTEEKVDIGFGPTCCKVPEGST